MFDWFIFVFILREGSSLWLRFRCHTNTFSHAQPQDWKAGRVFSTLLFRARPPTSSLHLSLFSSIIGTSLLWAVLVVFLKHKGLRIMSRHLSAWLMSLHFAFSTSSPAHEVWCTVLWSGLSFLTQMISPNSIFVLCLHMKRENLRHFSQFFKKASSPVQISITHMLMCTCFQVYGTYMCVCVLFNPLAHKPPFKYLVLFYRCIWW